MEEARAPGRPRSERVRVAVLSAIGDLIDRDGYESVTMEGIALTAGVGRQTLYRWWSSKSEILVEAVINGDVVLDEIRIHDTADLATDLSAWVRTFLEAMRRPAQVAIVRALAAVASASDVDVGSMYQQLTAANRSQLIDRIQSAVTAGQIRSEADPATVADLLTGVILLRVLARSDLSETTADQIVDVILMGIAQRR